MAAGGLSTVHIRTCGVGQVHRNLYIHTSIHAAYMHGEE